MKRCSPRIWLLVAAIAFGACRTGRSVPPKQRQVAGKPTKKGVTHVVQRGQTLYRISKTYGVSVDQLMKANGLKSAESMAVGMKLWIPGAAKVLDVPSTAVADSTPAKPAPKATAESAKPKSEKPSKAKTFEAPPEDKSEDPKSVAEKPSKKSESEKPEEKGAAEKPSKKADAETPAEKGETQPAKPKTAETPKKDAGENVAAKDAPADDKDESEGAVDATPPAKHADESKKKGDAATMKLRFIWPVKGFVQSQFGQRGSRPHDGIDIKADKGSPIFAVDDGEVIYSGMQRGYGNIVLVKHNDEFITIYAHNESNGVKQGERVKQGQVIATVGNTGRATNDHLHFEVRQNRVPKNPLLFLPEE